MRVSYVLVYLKKNLASVDWLKTDEFKSENIEVNKYIEYIESLEEFDQYLRNCVMHDVWWYIWKILFSIFHFM